MGFLEPGLESTPTNTDRCIDAYENEKGTTEEFIKDCFGMYIGCDPSFSPLFGNEVKEVFSGMEDVLSGWRFGFLRYTINLWNGSRWFDFLCILRIAGAIYSVCKFWLKVEVSEAMVLN